jgi:2'-5' RNA ligase
VAIEFSDRTGEHTGAMVALIPSAQDAARLAMDGGEPVDELHVTLCYLGDADDWGTGQRLSLAAEVAGAVEGTPPLEGDAFSVAYFNAGNEDIETALVYGIGGGSVDTVHRVLAAATENDWPQIPEQHKPWVAHVTAAYTDDLDAHRGLVGNLGPITFDRVRVAFGGQVYDIPLAAVGDDLGGDVEPPGEEADHVVPEFAADGVTGLHDYAGDREVKGKVNDVVAVPETLRVQADIYADACRVDVDMAGLVAAMGVYAPVYWRGPLAPIGTPTGDQRIFADDAISQATFPQPFRWQPTGLPGHDGAVTVGAITHAEKGTWNGAPHIVGEGYFLDPDIIPEVAAAIHNVANGVAGPSVDLDSFAAAVGEYRGKPIRVVLEGRQRGATLVSIPAFADLRLTLEYPEDEVQPGLVTVDPVDLDGLVAATGWCEPDDSIDYEKILSDPDLKVYGYEVVEELRQALPPLQATRGGITFATTRTSGWQSAPVAPRSSTFDADDAVKRIQAWAGIGTDQADEAKFRSMFLWAKPDQLDENNVPLGSAGYRLPWGDIFDGKPYLVYHAVYAAAALLEGGHGGLPNIPDDDKEQLRNTITKIYARLSEEFDDPSVRASWDRREEASAMDMETLASRFGTVYPSKRAFARRDLKGPTKPVVSADGSEYYGHLALWNTCHLGHSGSGICQKPVHSRVDYKHFYTGTIMTSEGELIEVGKVMGDGLHAATRRGMTAAAVKRYYEDTSTTFGLVRLYKDKWGIQFCGVPVPGVTEELAQKMRYSEISAHWHPIDNHLEVVAAIAVNRPAFGITASAATEDLIVDERTIVLVEDGVQTGLIASAGFDEQGGTMAANGGEDCGCGDSSSTQEDRVARILAMDPIPTHAELQARQARLSAHLG